MRTAFLVLLAALLPGCILEPAESPSPSTTPGEASDMVYVPTQCGTNPWQDGPQGQENEKNAAEAKKIKDHYAARNVTLNDITFEDVYAAVCAACHCPRGDWIHARVPPDDVGRARALGWEHESDMDRPDE